MSTGLVSAFPSSAATPAIQPSGPSPTGSTASASEQNSSITPQPDKPSILRLAQNVRLSGGTNRIEDVLSMNQAKASSVQVGTDGSGVLVGKSGNSYDILTNAHVLSVGQKNVTVTLPNGQKVQGTVVNANYDFESNPNKADLALIRVQSEEILSVAKVALSNAAMGDSVVVTGFPGVPDDQRSDVVLTPAQSGGRALYAAQAKVNQQLVDKGTAISGSYEQGLSECLGGGSSGGGVFSGGNLLGLNGQSASWILPPKTEGGGRPQTAPSDVQGYMIPAKDIANFLRENKSSAEGASPQANVPSGEAPSITPGALSGTKAKQINDSLGNPAQGSSLSVIFREASMSQGKDDDRYYVAFSSGGKKAEWVEMTRKEMRESGLIPTDAPSGSRLVQIGDTQYKLDSIRKVGPSLH